MTPTCGLHQFRRPVPATKRRVAPLQEQHLRPRHIRIHEVDRAPVPIAQFHHGLLRLRHATHGIAHAQHIIKYLHDGARIQVHDQRLAGHVRRHALHGAQIDRAHIAQILREDHVGPQFAKPRLIQAIQPGATAAILQRLANLTIDLGAGGRVRLLTGQHRSIRDLGWKVALVASAHQQIRATDAAQDLGCGRKQADHAHEGDARECVDRAHASRIDRNLQPPEPARSISPREDPKSETPWRWPGRFASILNWGS